MLFTHFRANRKLLPFSVTNSTNEMYMMFRMKCPLINPRLCGVTRITTLCDITNNNIACYQRQYFCTKELRRGSTIYALSSGYGKCGVAVVRVSGIQALKALQRMTSISKLEPRKAFLRKIHDPVTGEIIDKGLCLWFPGPNSFTGEDCIEFHVHGGPAVLDCLMKALSKLKFAHALPGEFTRRAFYNSKLDLTEIEGLADLIHAETEQQRKQALLQANGILRELYDGWRRMFIESIANLEAYVDFGEEDNIGSNILQKSNDTLRTLARKIEDHLSDGRKGEILRNGIRAVIIGAPNVGKSSLLNHLACRNAAIVTPFAGTTRDIVELNLNIAGYPVTLADTAGLTDNTKDLIEIEGIRRAKTCAENADLIILTLNAEKFVNSSTTLIEYISHYVDSLGLSSELVESLILYNELSDRLIIVANKVDLLDNESRQHLQCDYIIPISCKTEDGFEQLFQSLAVRFRQLCGDPSRENPIISQTRYRNHLILCLEHLNNYFKIISEKEYDVAIAIYEVREAVKELGKITGHITTEEILENIFKNFCIGK